MQISYLLLFRLEKEIFKQYLTEFFYKKNDKYRQIFKVPRLDWCAAMKGGKGSSLLMKSAIQAHKITNPELFHECPYVGIQGFTNFKLPQTLVSFLPIGKFRITTTLNSSLGVVGHTFWLQSYWYKVSSEIVEDERRSQ